MERTPRRCGAAAFRLSAGAFGAALLAGCASFSPDGGFDTVRQLAQQRIGQAPSLQRSAAEADAAQARVAELLAAPLSADGAVEIALLNNRELQASYAALGIAEADRVRAGRLANPSFRFGRLGAGGQVEIDRAIVFDLLGLLTLPLAQAVEQQRFERAQLQAAYDTVGLAAQTRRAYFDAVAAQQLLDYQAQVSEAAAAASDLARKMLAAGNFSALAQLREQAFHAEATLQLTRAQHQALAARERLNRLLALERPDFRLPARLPDLPAAPLQPLDAERTALATRLDLLMARRSTEATAKALGLTQATRLVNVLHLGYQNQSASGEAPGSGYEIELELPLFDFGSTRVARAEAIYLQSLNRTAQVAIDARSEVREAYSTYRSAYEMARHYRDEVVPLRRQISEQNLLRYNGMFASVFELLADSREQIATVAAALQAQREFWIADSQLQTALTGRSPGAMAAATPATAAAANAAGRH